MQKLVKSSSPLTLKIIEEALNILRGAVTIVYPMKLPPHDTIQMEFTNTEDLTGTQASKDVIEPSKAQLWFAGRQVLPGKKMSEYLGQNDKTKVSAKKCLSLYIIIITPYLGCGQVESTRRGSTSPRAGHHGATASPDDGSTISSSGGA